MSKLYECLIKNKLEDECTRLEILPPDQFNFVKNRDYRHPQSKFSNDIITNINAHIPTIACTLDVEKAYDTVWINGLIFKMDTIFRFDKHLCHVLLSFLTERSFKLLLNGHKSSSRQIMAGVPQGGVLSALLYIIYVADLPPPSPFTGIQRLQYAADILVYVSKKNLQRSQDDLNNYINVITTHYKAWKLKLNPSKSESIVFKGRNRDHSATINRLHKNIKINVNGQILVLNNHIKYLGVTFSKKPNFVTHITNVIEKGTELFKPFARSYVEPVN